MLDLNELLEKSPFSMPQKDKEVFYQRTLKALTSHHDAHCTPYHHILKSLNFDPNSSCPISDFPFLPVRLFKDQDLVSVPPSEIFKTMTSSGTTGQRPSKIYLDRNTAALQTKVLAKIVTDFIGKKRLPLLIIDSPSVLKDRNLFSARGAGILGFSIFGQDPHYALNEAMELDLNTVAAFLEKHQGQELLVFGFTSIIWEYFYKKLVQLKKRLPLDRALLIHGGGWKKLAEEAIDNEEYKKSLQQWCGLSRVHNYYGMVEQTGSIFMECEAGVFHCSLYSDILTRRPNFSLCERGEKGLIELISLLPQSYPGHILLSEDMGEVLGTDNCSCGRLGKYFKVYGRAKNAEVRGCSDARN